MLAVAMILSCFLSVFALAQNNGIIRKISVTDPSTGASVTIHDHSGVVPVYGNSDARIKGYRVRIFFDNSQDARSQSYAVERDFKTKHPFIPVYLTYETPYFKITVGDCMTKEEATMLWGKLLAEYPKAFIVSEEIPLSVFEKLPEPIYIQTDTTSIDFIP